MFTKPEIAGLVALGTMGFLGADAAPAQVTPSQTPRDIIAVRTIDSCNVRDASVDVNHNVRLVISATGEYATRALVDRGFRTPLLPVDQVDFDGDNIYTVDFSLPKEKRGGSDLLTVYLGTDVGGQPTTYTECDDVFFVDHAKGTGQVTDISEVDG